jgi:hypothetical protein
VIIISVREAVNAYPIIKAHIVVNVLKATEDGIVSKVRLLLP